MFCSNKKEDRMRPLWLCIIFLTLCIFSHSIDGFARENQMGEGSASKGLNPKNDKIFYDDRQRGWYWYEAGKEGKETKTSTSTEYSPTQPPNKVPSKYSYNEMWVMYPDDFKAYSSKVTKQAVQRENIYPLGTLILKIKTNPISLKFSEQIFQPI